MTDSGEPRAVAGASAGSDQSRKCLSRDKAMPCLYVFGIIYIFTDRL